MTSPSAITARADMRRILPATLYETLDTYALTHPDTPYLDVVAQVFRVGLETLNVRPRRAITGRPVRIDVPAALPGGLALHTWVRADVAEALGYPAAAPREKKRPAVSYTYLADGAVKYQTQHKRSRLHPDEVRIGKQAGMPFAVRDDVLRIVSMRDTAARLERTHGFTLAEDIAAALPPCPVPIRKEDSIFVIPLDVLEIVRQDVEQYRVQTVLGAVGIPPAYLKRGAKELDDLDRLLVRLRAS